MSRRRRRKRHGFLKFILVMMILAMLGAFCYVRFYPGGSVEGLKSHVREAGQLARGGASEAVESIREKLGGESLKDNKAGQVIKRSASGALEALKEKLASQSRKSPKGILKSTSDINLRSGGDGYYYFTYDGEDYRALYSSSTWTIYNSYRITNRKDITIICQALSDVHPVPSRDWQSYRTAEDMAYEWDQHNKIYLIAPKDGRTKERTRNVDLDPEDQGKTYEDYYRENFG